MSTKYLGIIVRLAIIVLSLVYAPMIFSIPLSIIIIIIGITSNLNEIKKAESKETDDHESE